MHAHHEQEHPVTPPAQLRQRTSTAVPADGTVPPDTVLALQSTIGNAALAPLLAGEETHESTSDSPVHRVLRGSGRPLDQDVRADMEARLGADFSDVRVHTDTTADVAADSVRAEAFTSGSHVVFRRGGYDTSSTAGRQTLAHELTHVVQQRSGPVEGTPTDDGLSVSDPRDRSEREAEATAVRAMSGHPEQATPTAPAASGQAAAVPVARLMTEQAFKSAAADFGKVRSKSRITGIDEALQQYHQTTGTQYQQRADALNVIITRCVAYEQASQNDTRKRGVRELLAQARVEVVVYQAMAQSETQTDQVEQFRSQAIALDAIIAHEGDQPETALQLHNTLDIPSNLQRLAGSLFQSAPARISELADDNVAILQGLVTKQGVPPETVEMLNEVLSHGNKISFQGGAPQGTRLTNSSRPGAPPEKYTFRAAMGHGGGSTERAGYFAHEMTHVAANESFGNTALMLLFPPNIQDNELQTLIQQRGTTIDALSADLETTRAAFTPSQYDLVKSKLTYGTSKDRVESYVRAYTTSGELDPTTVTRVNRWISIAGDRTGLMVEYDTVLNQMLVYLALWQIDPGNAFYIRLRQAAKVATDYRAAARAATAAAASQAAQAASASQAPAPATSASQVPPAASP
jgi:hypothetical protein